MCLQNLMTLHQWFFKILRKQKVMDTHSVVRSVGRSDGQREKRAPIYNYNLLGGGIITCTRGDR